MTEWTVHFQRGTRVGTRSLRMIRVEAPDDERAIALARAEFPTARQDGYRITRIDFWDEGTGRLVKCVR